MKVFQVLVLLTIVSSVAAFGAGMAIGAAFGAIEGLASGLFKGSAAFAPVAQDGLMAMKDFFGSLGGATNQAGEGIGSIANQGASGLGSIMNMFSGMFGSLFGDWSTMLGSLFSSGGDIFQSLFNVLRSMFEGLFSIVGGFTSSSRLQFNKMVANSGHVFATTMKLKLNPQKNQQKIKQEILAAKKVMETRHQSPAQLIKNIKAKAPQLTSALSQAYSHSIVELQKHMKVLNPEAKRGVQRMHLQVKQAKLDIGGILSQIISMMTGGGSGLASIFGTGMSILQNMFHVAGMLV